MKVGKISVGSILLKIFWWNKFRWLFNQYLIEIRWVSNDYYFDFTRNKNIQITFLTIFYLDKISVRKNFGEKKFRWEKISVIIFHRNLFVWRMTSFWLKTTPIWSFRLLFTELLIVNIFLPINAVFRLDFQRKSVLLVF